MSISTQFENVGDALINRELVRAVARESEIGVDLSRAPDAFRKTLGFADDQNVRTLGSYAALLRELVLARVAGRPTYYFLSPGGYVGEQHWRRAMGNVAKTCLLSLFALVGVKVCLIGVSYERLGSRHTRLLRWRSRILAAHLVRDSTSLAYATELGITVHGLIPDLAYGAWETSAFHRRASSRPAVGVSFRGDQYAGQRNHALRFCGALARELAPAVPLKVIMQVERDAPLGAELVDVLRNAGRMVEVIEASQDIERCFAAYADCSVIVSNRLHALLIGGISGAAPVPLVEPLVNAKVVGWANEARLSSNVVTAPPAEAARIVAAAIKDSSFDRLDGGAEHARWKEVMHTLLSRTSIPPGE